MYGLLDLTFPGVIFSPKAWGICTCSRYFPDVWAPIVTGIIVDVIVHVDEDRHRGEILRKGCKPELIIDFCGVTDFEWRELWISDILGHALGQSFSA